MNHVLLHNPSLNQWLEQWVSRATSSSLAHGVDLLDTPDAYQFDFALPGFSKDQIELQTHQNQLHIKAQKPQPEGQNVVHQSIPKRVEYKIPMNSQLDPQSIRAQFQNGVLSVFIAKSKKQSIEIISID